MDEAGGQGLGDEQAAAVAGGQGGGVVEQEPGVEDAEHLWVGMADAVTAGVAGRCSDRRWSAKTPRAPVFPFRDASP